LNHLYFWGVEKMKKLNYSIENKGGIAKIRLSGHIGSWKTNSEAITALIDDLIDAGIQHLDAYINTYGGSIFDATEIINQIKRFKGKKNVQVGAIAASSGGYILCAFDKVRAFKNSQAMVHEPSQLVQISSEADFDSSKQLYVNSREIIIDAFEKKLNIDRDAILEMMQKTTWINAKYGKEIGLFDEIIDEESESLPDNPENISNLYKEGLPVELENSIKSNKNEPNKNKMKKVLMALGLPENATDEQAVELVNSIKENAVKSLSALATVKGFEASKIEKLANSDFNTTLEMVTEKKVEAPTVTPVNAAELIAAAMKGNGTEKVKSVEDYSPLELENLFEKDQEAYEELINQ